MSPELIGWLAIAALFLMLAFGIPVAFALTAIGLVGYAALAGLDPALGIAGLVPYAKTAVYTFTAVPLFIVMGNFAFYAGFGTDVYNTARHWVKRLPGGLAQATVVGAAGFGAACGSGLAGCAMMTKVAVPEMIRLGYDRKLAIGVAAAAGPIAQMIPPSIMMVLYGIITEQSVAKLLIAGIIPGIVCALVYMAVVYFRVKANPRLAPAPEPFVWRQALASLKGAWAVALLAILVMGGIYSGVFTPTEAAGVGAFGALSLALITRRMPSGGLSAAFLDTAKTTSMLYLILVGAYIFGYLLTITRLPAELSGLLTSLDVPRWVILISIIIFYLIIGMFMDMVPAMFITLPLLYPTVVKLGYDPIWFGVLIVQLGEISLLTPPFGLNLIIIKGLMEEVEMTEIIRGVSPFIFGAIVTLAIYIAFPELVLFLPNMMLTH